MNKYDQYIDFSTLIKGDFDQEYFLSKDKKSIIRKLDKEKWIKFVYFGDTGMAEGTYYQYERNNPEYMWRSACAWRNAIMSLDFNESGYTLIKGEGEVIFCERGR